MCMADVIIAAKYRGRGYGKAGLLLLCEQDNHRLSDMDLTNDYIVLLSYRPETFDAYVAKNIDLVLSGHAHGGQFRIPIIGGLIAPNQGFFPKYDAGMYCEKSTTMIVSRGIGNSIITLRLNNRPKIVCVELIGNS